jgi:hypothetical protein
VREAEKRIHGVADAVGGSDDLIRRRVGEGRWKARQAGVVQTDSREMSWTDRLFAAVLAGGPDTLVSHRAALVVWGMDGVRSAPVEVTVPYSNRPVPQEVIVHRTRRAMSSRDVEGLPVTGPERTLLDVSLLLPPLVVAKALESSIRRNLTTVDSILEEISTKGGRGCAARRS